MPETTIYKNDNTLGIKNNIRFSFNVRYIFTPTSYAHTGQH